MFLLSSILLHQSLSIEWIWKHCTKDIKEERSALINTKIWTGKCLIKTNLIHSKLNSLRKIHFKQKQVSNNEF